MMKRVITLVGFTVASALFCGGLNLCNPQSAYVQAAPLAANSSNLSYSISMSPSSSEIHAAPGGSVKRFFSVINQGNIGYDTKLSVNPYHVSGESYDPRFTSLPGTTDASKWVHISGEATRKLEAGRLMDIDYTVTIPANTAPGGYYAVVFAETIPPVSSGVSSHNRVGNILYITVDGTITRRGAIQGHALPKLITSSSMPIALTVQNNGGVHFLTTADVSVTDVFGKSVFKASQQRYVLPQTQRLITADWKQLPPIGLYKIQRTATIAGKPQSLPATWVFIARTWMLVVLAAVIMSIILYLGYQAMRRRWSKKAPLSKKLP